MNKVMLAGACGIVLLWSCQLVFKPEEGAKGPAGIAVAVDTPTRIEAAQEGRAAKKLDSVRQDGVQQADTTVSPFTGAIDTKNVQPEALVQFAKTLVGVPYWYGSTDPAVGFDCSGFITYVFNHFGITVPRSSVDFTHVGREVPVTASKPGDLILFTGTDSTIRLVGHMGIIISPPGDSVAFIHSTSGKAYGVTISPLNTYYQGRYMKTIRVFEDGF